MIRLGSIHRKIARPVPQKSIRDGVSGALNHSTPEPDASQSSRALEDDLERTLHDAGILRGFDLSKGARRWIRNTWSIEIWMVRKVESLNAQIDADFLGGSELAAD